MDSAQPLSSSDRILALDVLRGFAMAGVLVAYAMWSLGTLPEANWSVLDRSIDRLFGFLVDGKFYTILAFLFGVGFSIQLERGSDDAAAVDLYCRRLGVLAGIGLIHALLLRNGDILLPYALTGFLLVPFRRASDRTIVIAAFAALLIALGSRAAWPMSALPVPQRPQLENAPFLTENLAWVRFWYRTAIFSWPINLTMFLFGLLAGRRHLLINLARDRNRLRAIAAAGLCVGIALYLLRMVLEQRYAGSALSAPVLGLLFTFHCWGMSSAYAAVLLLALRHPFGVAALAPLAAIGRMALTNYLMQALLIVPLCLVFGLFDRWTPATTLLLAVLIFTLVQLPASLLWLRHFQFGPAEWVWRSLTYSQMPRFKKAAAPASLLGEI